VVIVTVLQTVVMACPPLVTPPAKLVVRGGTVWGALAVPVAGPDVGVGIGVAAPVLALGSGVVPIELNAQVEPASAKLDAMVAQ
jgi:hypothetical protein